MTATAPVPTPAPTDSGGSGFGPKLLVPVLVGPLLNPINTTMVSVALAPISRDLGIGAAQAIWLVAALYLASAVAQPTMGKLADRFGPKKVFLSGLVIVGVAGVVPEFLTGFGGAVTARVLIGIGTSSAYPAALTTLRQHSARIGKPTPPLVLGALSITSLVSAAAGPPLGGALIAAFGWHAIFLVNVPLAVFGIVVSLLWLPSDRLRPQNDDDLPVLQALDPVGMLLMTGTVSALLVFLLDLSAGLWWLLGTAVVLLVALVLWELRAVKPFVDVRLLARNGALSRTYVRLFLVYLLAYTMTYGFSQWVQDVAGYSSDAAGYIQLPAAIVAGIASFLVARKTAVRGRSSPRPWCRSSAACSCSCSIRGPRGPARAHAGAVRRPAGLRVGVEPGGALPGRPRGVHRHRGRALADERVHRRDRGVLAHRRRVRDGSHDAGPARARVGDRGRRGRRERPDDRRPRARPAAGPLIEPVRSRSAHAGAAGAAQPKTQRTASIRGSLRFWLCAGAAPRRRQCARAAPPALMQPPRERGPTDGGDRCLQADRWDTGRPAGTAHVHDHDQRAAARPVP